MLIPKEVFAIADCADENSCRYALGGIHFERDDQGKAHAVATDGRRLIHATWQEDDPKEYPQPEGFPSSEHVAGFETILSVKDCKEAAKLPPKRSPKAILTNVLLSEPGANGKVKYAATDNDRAPVIEASSIEGRFPRWREVFPSEKERSIKVLLDVRYLRDVCATINKVIPADSDSTYVELTIPKNGEKPVTLTRERNGRKVEALIMPLDKAKI